MVIYDVQEKLQLFKKPLGDFNDGPKGNRLPDPLFNAALLNVVASIFFHRFLSASALKSGRQSYRRAEIHCYCCMYCEQMWESQLLPKMGSTLNFAVVLK